MQIRKELLGPIGPLGNKTIKRFLKCCKCYYQTVIGVQFILEQAMKVKYRYSSTRSLMLALDRGGLSMPHPSWCTPSKEIWYPL